MNHDELDAVERLRVTALALGAAKGVAALSAGLALVAALGVLVSGALASVIALFFASMALGAGLAAQWIAFRVRFDAGLFAALGDDAKSGGLDVAQFDEALVALSMLPPDKAGRTITARCDGALRLLRILGWLVIAQGLLIVLAGASLQVG